MDRISALMDGELEDEEAQSTMARLKADAALRNRWDEFHLVRDALRGEPLLSAGFDERLSRRLAEEPTVLAPRRPSSKTRRIATYAMSAAASLSAAALVAWVALPLNSPSERIVTGPGPEKAPPVVTVEHPTVVPHDGRANHYLFVHEGVSPASRLQSLASYIRSVSTHPAERR